MFRYTGNGHGNGSDAALRPSVSDSEPAASNTAPRRLLEFAAGVVLGEVSSGGYQAIIAIFQARYDALAAAGDWRVRHLDRETFRRFGPVSLGPILGVLGLKIIAVEDPEQMEKMRPRLTQAKFRRWLTYASGTMLARKRPRKSYLWVRDPEIARAARMRQVEATSPTKRRRIAKHAAVARWSAVREAAKETGGMPPVGRVGLDGKARKTTGNRLPVGPAPVARPSAIAAAASAHAVMSKA